MSYTSLKKPFSVFSFQDKGPCLFLDPVIFKIYQHSNIESFFDHINSPLSTKARVIHLFYEAGHLINQTGIQVSGPLGIVADYQRIIPLKMIDHELQSFYKNSCDLKLKKNWSLKKYESAFLKAYEHLLNGDCYQINLTCEFLYQIKDLNPWPWILKLMSSSHQGAYAHATYVSQWNKLFLSNTPECLFEARDHHGTQLKSEGQRLWSTPIKGSVACEGPHEFLAKWNELKLCSKNMAELDMITDLIRNDLSKIDLTPSKVLSQRLPLIVPQILHQYSLITTTLDRKVDMDKILKALFPGGSITGAPKKRVMQIIRKLEKRDRGLYCGSTLLMSSKGTSASINIRSAEFDFNQQVMRYQSGGGITLMSQCLDEFNEMNLKVDSYTRLFTSYDVRK